MAITNRTVDLRTADEAVASAEQQLAQGLEGQRIVDETAGELLENAQEVDPTLRRIEILESQLSSALEMLEGVQRMRTPMDALNDPTLGEADEQAMEKIRLARIQGLVRRGHAVQIIIHPTGQTAAENAPVYLGLNGDTIKVPRGIPTRVHPKFLMVLEEARQRYVEPIVLPNGQRIFRNVSSIAYPYSLVDYRQAA